MALRRSERRNEMKMMSKTDIVICDCYLMVAKNRLECCIKRMKGKYGTKYTVQDMERYIKNIEHAISDEPKFKHLNQFRNPPNTPKSRRLGWYEERETNEQK